MKELNKTIASNVSSRLTNTHDKVTTGQFVAMIIRALNTFRPKVNLADMGSQSEYMSYALGRGLIEDYDMGNENYPIERRAAARIAHETLLIELAENDEQEWSAANRLQDLYICRTCVMHIAQMYVKGIMPGRDNSMFDVKGKINYTEAQAIVEKLFDKEKRIPQKETLKLKAEKLSPEEAMELVTYDKSAMLIDVRTKDEYRGGHVDGSVCIPLQDLVNNPFSVCENRDNPIILYCIRGYKSSIAALTLIDAGYSRVYIIPGIEEYNYNIII